MKKIIVLALCLIALMFCLVGCSNSDDSESDTSATTYTGQVTAIDGNSVTLSLGELTESKGTAPTGDAPTDSNTAEDDTTTSTASSDTAKPAAPSGDAPAMTTFTAGENTTTLDIGDDVTVTIEGMSENTEGSIDDIKVGDVLVVTVDADGNVTEVTVKNVMPSSGFGGNGGPGAATNNGSSGTNSGETSANSGDTTTGE